MSLRQIIATAALLTLAACATSTDRKPEPPLPQRVVLHYDFSGDWVATAGDQCSERLDLSENIFLSIGTAPEGGPDRYYITDFFMLEPGQPAQANVGVADGSGKLTLSVDTEGTVHGRHANITYTLKLEQQGPYAIRLYGFAMKLWDAQDPPQVTDLLAKAAADPTIPILGASGSKGLCLKRQPLS